MVHQNLSFTVPTTDFAPEFQYRRELERLAHPSCTLQPAQDQDRTAAGEWDHPGDERISPDRCLMHDGPELDRGISSTSSRRRGRGFGSRGWKSLDPEGVRLACADQARADRAHRSTASASTLENPHAIRPLPPGDQTRRKNPARSGPSALWALPDPTLRRRDAG